MFNGCDSGSSGSGGSGASSSTPTKIVVIGDSFGTGFGVATGFPVYLQDIVGVPVINNSARSRETGVGIGLASSLIAQHQPSHLVVLLGTNDALNGSSVSGAVANLQTIANIAKDAGVTPVIGTIALIPRSASADARAAQISSGIQGLSNARIAAIRGKLNSSNYADSVHPNNDGQRIIAMQFADAL